MINDEYLIEHGYRQYKPTKFDHSDVIARFQKRFDDKFGKKYFIDVLKWSNYYVPDERRDNWWKPYIYEYEIQVNFGKEENYLNLKFFSSWKLEDVEKFMEDFFEKMKLNYYESWDGDRRVRPDEH